MKPRRILATIALLGVVIIEAAHAAPRETVLRLITPGGEKELPAIALNSADGYVKLDALQQEIPLSVIRLPESPLMILVTSVNCVPLVLSDATSLISYADAVYIHGDSAASALGCRYITQKKSAGRLECADISSLAPTGNEVGDRAPGFRLENSDGLPVASEALLDSGGLVVAFIRSADWEPFSRDLLTRLDANQKNFAKAGARLVVIHGYEQSVAKQWRDTLQVSAPLLKDNLGAVMIAYGVYRQPRLPQPTIFVLDSNGVIRWKHEYGEEREPPEMGPVIEAVKGLKEKGERIKDKNGSSDSDD